MKKQIARWIKLWHNRRAYNKVGSVYIYLFDQIHRETMYYETDSLNVLIEALDRIDAEYALI